VRIGGIEYGDEDVDHPHRIVFSHVIVEELGEQNALRSVFALNKALHQEPRLKAALVHGYADAVS
jgi:hypothetical protein